MTTTGAAGTEDVGKVCTAPHPANSITTKIEILSDAVMRETVAMIESGMWIFLVEAAAAGCLFVGLIWWVVKGTGERDRRLKEFDEKAQKDAEMAANIANNTDTTDNR